MEWNTITQHAYMFLVCATLLLGFLLAWFFHSFHDKQAWPPGPLALPIIGHLHLLGPQPHVSLFHLSKRHGALMRLWFGCYPTIIASSPEMAKEILHVHDLTFASRPRFEASAQLLFDCSDIVFAPHGPYWKLMRKLCVTDLLTSKRIEEFQQLREEEVRELVRDVLKKGMGGQKEVQVRESLLGASNNINCRMTIGAKMREVSDSMQGCDLTHLVNEVLCLLGVFNIGDYIPCLKWMDLQGFGKRMRETRKTWDRILQEVIDRRRELGQAAADGSTFLDVLLRVAATDNLNLRISDDNIKGVLLDLFTGGADTTASTVEWALAELLNNPTDMQRVQEELDNVVGKSCLVKDIHISKLPYLRAIVKEVFRLHPPAPLLAPRETTQECVIAHYKIPAKTRAYVNVWAIGRDPSVWNKPLEFCPKRFLDADLDLCGQHFELLPFGSGRRGCPGLALGMAHVHLMLAALLQSFTWSIPSNTFNDGHNINHVDMAEKFGITMTMAKPLFCKATPRLLPHLF